LRDNISGDLLLLMRYAASATGLGPWQKARDFALALLKFACAGFFALTSIYSLLAFLPYTYHAFVKAPAYAWIIWFTTHYVLLYWVVAGVVAALYLGTARKKLYWLLAGFLGTTGIYVSAAGLLLNIQNTWQAYALALAMLFPAILMPWMEVRAEWIKEPQQKPGGNSLPYSTAALIGILVALLSAIAARLRDYSEVANRTGLQELQIAAWSLVSHVVLAVLVASVFNLVRAVAARTSRPRKTALLATFAIIFAALWGALLRLLSGALSLQGWPAYVYAAALAMAITCCGCLLPLSVVSATGAVRARVSRTLLAYAALLLFAAAAVACPVLLQQRDWDFLLQRICVLVVWVGISLCVFRLRLRRAQYSLSAIVLAIVLSVFGYKGLLETQIFWAKSLGATDDDILRVFEGYGNRDVSFQIAHLWLGNGRPAEPCGELCGILRQHTNIRYAEAVADLKLVEDLAPTAAPKPHIFILVVDSVRPDYLGAYNPRATFTPNFDKLARESLVMRNAFTQYAGTTLSEPAIWAGASLLHTHYLQPFDRVNNLQKLARTDGYQMYVSMDTVLRELLPPVPDIHRLDEDKRVWNQFEVCSTFEQFSQALDARQDRTRPVFFYAQPMNVHQFARNNLPLFQHSRWDVPAGFSARIAHQVRQVDACFGKIIDDLKARGMYENSIIVATSDHGDVTNLNGDFGRNSHSVGVFPEIMRVPLIVHLPARMRSKYVWDDKRLALLTDITPSLYYLLGHRPIIRNPEFGRPLFTETRAELESYARDHVLLASDVRAFYGILAENGRFFYGTNDSPAQSFFFDLAHDTDAQNNLANEAVKAKYNQLIIEHLHNIAGLYQYKPGVPLLSSLAQKRQ
jgi:hypothetical protein